MHFRVFSEIGYRMEDIFWAAKSSNVYLGCLIFFWGVNV